MNFSNIKFEINDHVAILTLNRPEIRNAISDDEIVDEIVGAIKMVQDDFNMSVLIVTGEGSAFCAGGNIKDMKNREGIFSGTPEEIKENYRRGIQRIPLAFYNLDVPTIAAVNGPAIGAGCDLACMCDIRIASEKARFGETFVSVGLIPGDGGSYFLSRAVGFQKALELAFTSRVIDAEEAYRIGLVSEVVPAKKLMERALQVAGEISSKPPRILRMVKRLMYLSQNMTLPEVLEISAAYQALSHYTEDHHEAVSAMLEKRDPVFKGK